MTVGIRTAKFNCRNHGEWWCVWVGGEGDVIDEGERKNNLNSFLSSFHSISMKFKMALGLIPDLHVIFNSFSPQGSCMAILKPAHLVEGEGQPHSMAFQIRGGHASLFCEGNRESCGNISGSHGGRNTDAEGRL